AAKDFNACLNGPLQWNCRCRCRHWNSSRTSTRISKELFQNRRIPYAQSRGRRCLVVRYLGNTNTKEVHDTQNEQSNCQLSEIKPEHRRWFASLKEAVNEGFDRCHWCIGGS